MGSTTVPLVGSVLHPEIVPTLELLYFEGFLEDEDGTLVANSGSVDTPGWSCTVDSLLAPTVATLTWPDDTFYPPAPEFDYIPKPLFKVEVSVDTYGPDEASPGDIERHGTYDGMKILEEEEDVYPPEDIANDLAAARAEQQRVLAALANEMALQNAIADCISSIQKTMQEMANANTLNLSGGGNFPAGAAPSFPALQALMDAQQEKLAASQATAALLNQQAAIISETVRTLEQAAQQQGG